MAEHGTARRRRIHPFSLVVFGLTVLGTALIYHEQAGGQNGTTNPPAVAQPPVQPVNAQPLDQPLAMMYEARRKFADVRDYTCTLQSRENVRGKLLDENVMTLKVRNQPFSIYMRWIAPKAAQGQEVCFVLGKNDNMMRVHSNTLGKGKALGFVSISPTDKRVADHSRHTIYEAGLGNLIEQTIKLFELAKKMNKTQVKIGEYVYNNRRCTRIETMSPERLEGFYCYRSVLYIDNDTKLPVRAENYDWPRQGGPPEGELLEMFSYIDLRFNVGLTDQEFSK